MFKLKFPLSHHIHVYDDCGMLRKTKEMYHQLVLTGQTDKDIFEEVLEEFERPDALERSHTNLPLDEKVHRAVRQSKQQRKGAAEKKKR
jgi:actin-related protein